MTIEQRQLLFTDSCPDFTALLVDVLKKKEQNKAHYLLSTNYSADFKGQCKVQMCVSCMSDDSSVFSLVTSLN